VREERESGIDKRKGEGSNYLVILSYTEEVVGVCLAEQRFVG
jgi:hypothetical protein